MKTLKYTNKRRCFSYKCDMFHSMFQGFKRTNILVW